MTRGPSRWLVLLSGLYPLALFLALGPLLGEAVEGGGLVLDASVRRLFAKTLLLALAVSGTALLTALPLAFLRAASDYPAKGLLDVVAVLPLAIPGYVLAYAWLAVGGAEGLFAQRFGFAFPRFEGLVGAWWALSLYTFPYFYLGLKNALLRFDAAYFEAARTLGEPPLGAFRRVVVPIVGPALLGSALVVVLHVVADFGVVALMRYPTFSYAVYLAYETAFDRKQAARLALWLLVLVVGLVLVEVRYRPPSAVEGLRPWRVPLGRLRLFGHLYLAVVSLLALGVPLLVLLAWVGQGLPALTTLGTAIARTLLAGVPAAGLAALWALFLGYLAARWSRASWMARTAYLGYALPPVALALGLVFLSLGVLPWLYQTLFLLIFAYVLHFLAEALGPVRAMLARLPQGLEEAARTLGEGPLGVFLRVVWPLARSGVLAGGLLVFLASIKELPLTLILAPIGYDTLALEVWNRVREGLFAEAAPYALALVGIGFLGTGVLSLTWRRG